MLNIDNLRPPIALTSEHIELHAQLAAMTSESGPVGAAARTVAAVVEPHFAKEDYFALPPLSLLPTIAHHGATADMARVLPLIEQLRTRLFELLDEHARAMPLLERLREIGVAEGRAEVVIFVDRMKHHALAEEEIHYPAALLLGEFLKLKGLAAK